MAIYLGNIPIAENVTIQQQGGDVTIDNALSDTSENPVQNKVINAALNNKANLTDIPTTLPANGGNADTVNGLTVQTAVPANAVFTDTKVTAVGNHYTPSGGTTTSASGGTLTDITNSSAGVQVVTGVTKDDAGHVTGVTSVALKSTNTNTTYPVATTTANGLMSSTDKSKLDGIATGANKYTHPSYTARTGVPTANVAPAFGGTFTVSQPVSDATGHITAINSRTITIPATAASASAAGLVSTGAQTLAGNKTFNGQVIPAGASAVGTAQARKIYAGTSDMTAGTTKLETGAIYLVYE